MNKLILLSIVLGSYMFAGIHGEADNSLSQSNTNAEKIRIKIIKFRRIKKFA